MSEGSLNQHERLRFGVFEVSFRAYELRKHGMRVRLRGQPFDLLRLLLDRPGEVVTREEMKAQLWSDDTFVDFERSLNSAIQKLRSVLGDSPDKPVYIETIPRVGYRFVAPVSPLDPLPANGSAPAAAPPPEPPPAPPIRARRYRRTLVLVSALLLILALGAIFWYRFGRRPQPVLTEMDREILAGVTNSTGDPAFDSSLGQALRVKLAESPFLNLVPDAAFRRALPAVASANRHEISVEDAQKACTALGAAAVLAGDVSQANGTYVVRFTATRCSGGAFARAREVAASRDQVLNALDRAARDLRIRLGEPQASVASYDTPAARATSSSLAALKAFSIGEEKRALGLDYETIPDYQLATDLDPDFALAYARLGVIYQNAQEWDLSRHYFEKAFELREHTSERERLYITSHYYGGVTNEAAKAEEVYELWRQLYPRDVVAPNNLSGSYYRTGQIEKAVAAGRDAVRLDPGNAFCVSNLARALQRSGNYAEAKSLYDRAVAHKWDGMLIHMMRYTIAFGENDDAAMQAQLNWARGNPREGEMLDTAAWGAMASGQVAKGRALFHQASRIGLNHDLKEYAALVLLDDAQIETDLGFSPVAARDVEEAFHLAGDSVMVEAYSALALARIGEVRRAQVLFAKTSKAAPLDTILQQVTLPTGRALVALSEKHPQEALEALESAKPYDLGTDANLLTIYYRGQAYLETRRYREAAAEFQRLLAVRRMTPNSPYLALSRLGLAETRLAAGDPAAACKEFEAFFAAWKDADSGIPILKTARAEYARAKGSS
jgi:eukaryotic-like serine/threonine-protein kinase